MIFKKNKIFFIGFSIFLLIGLVPLFFIEKGAVILFFSDHRSDFNNAFFTYGTMLGEHFTYIIVFFTFLFVRYRYALLFPLIGLFIMISSNLLKRFFQHPRPMRYFETTELSESINLVPGQKVYMAFSSFPSGHTMSGFAVFALLAFLTSRNDLKIVFLILAIIVGLSRIYLVHHFLEDVIFGAFLGTLAAVLFYHLQSKLPNQPDIWYNKSLSISPKKFN